MQDSVNEVFLSILLYFEFSVVYFDMCALQILNYISLEFCPAFFFEGIKDSFDSQEVEGGIFGWSFKWRENGKSLSIKRHFPYFLKSGNL